MKTVVMLLAGMFASPLMAITISRVSIEQPEEITRYHMYDEGKIYFSGNSMVIDTVGNGKEVRVALSNIGKMTFETVELSETGVEHVVASSPQVSLYPNPVVEMMTVTLSGDGSFPYHIYSLGGECVMKGVATNGSTIDLRSLPNGTYIFELNNTYLKICKL